MCESRADLTPSYTTRHQKRKREICAFDLLNVGQAQGRCRRHRQAAACRCRRPLPRTPTPQRWCMRAPPVMRMMDKCTYGMDIWTTLQVDHMPTPTEHLPTWARLRPDALRLPYCLNKQIPGTCPPWVPDGEGWRDGESFALPGRSQVWELSPCAGRSRGIDQGSQRPAGAP